MNVVIMKVNIGREIGLQRTNYYYRVAFNVFSTLRLYEIKIYMASAPEFYIRLTKSAV